MQHLEVRETVVRIDGEGLRRRGRGERQRGGDKARSKFVRHALFLLCGVDGIQPPACQASAQAIAATTSPRNDSSTACSQTGAPARSGRLAATGTNASARTAYHGSCARIMVAAARSMVTTVAASIKVAPPWIFLPMIICTSRNAPDPAATAKPYKP